MPTVRRCCIVGCMSNSRQYPNLQFFQFPRPDNPFFKLWTQACQASLSRILPFKKPVVCALHFHPHCIGGRRLTGSAIPSLKLEVPSNLKAVEQQAMVEEIERSRKCAYINAVVYEWLVRANLNPQLRGSITHGMIKEKAETAKQIIGCDSFMADNRWLNRFRETHLTGFAQKLASNQLKPIGPSLWIPDIVQDLAHLFPPTSSERMDSYENVPEKYMPYMKQYGEYEEEDDEGSEQSQSTYGPPDTSAYGQDTKMAAQSYYQQQQAAQTYYQQQQHHQQQQQHHQQQQNGYGHHYNPHHHPGMQPGTGYNNAYQDYYNERQQQQQHLYHQQQQQHAQQQIHQPQHNGYNSHPVMQQHLQSHTSPPPEVASMSPKHQPTPTPPPPQQAAQQQQPPSRPPSHSPSQNGVGLGSNITSTPSAERSSPFPVKRPRSTELDAGETQPANKSQRTSPVNGLNSHSPPLILPTVINESNGESNNNTNPSINFKIKLPLANGNGGGGSLNNGGTNSQGSSTPNSQTNNLNSRSNSPKSQNGLTTNGHTSPTPSQSTNTKELETYAQALEYLKPLEDFALFKENFRAIGLISQLEMILKKAEKAVVISSASAE